MSDDVCARCGEPLRTSVLTIYGGDWPDWPVCEFCRRHCPQSLLKACIDPFSYALRLRTGDVIEFESATIHGDFVTLKNDAPETALSGGLPFPCPRGVDVRLDDIVWCADAPHGS